MIFGFSQPISKRLSSVFVGLSFFGIFAFVSCFSNNAIGQDSKLQQAMGITPKQVVDYEQPGVADLKECTFATIKDPSGFIVHHSNGRILRRFIDNNKDNKLDQWSYYKNGLEVYRDLDTNFDGRTDAYRWLGPAGTRWGVDKDQNGTIDYWRIISAEEVAYECFEAVRNFDQDRFDRLLLTSEELESFKLGSKIRADVDARLKKARSGFLAMSRAQKAITSKAKFVDAGNGRPQMMGAGTLGSKLDLMVYDQASGFFDAAGGANQLALGSLVRTGNVWRMVELPEIVDPKKPLVSGGAFFPLPEYGGTSVGPTAFDKERSKLYDALTKVDTDLTTAKGAQVEQLEKRKADILTQFYLTAKDPKTKRDWLENMSDSVAHAYQMDRFDGGVKYLENFMMSQKSASGMDYVQWTTIFAKYGWTNANGDKNQREAGYKRYIQELDVFQRRFGTSPNAADALIQLAVHHEVNSEDEPTKAKEYYSQCVKRFPKTKYGRRANGALKRLGSYGKSFNFVGKTADGRSFNLKSANGKIVVLHFWEINCCGEDDIRTLAKLQEKYKDELVIVSCNIEGYRMDEQPEVATKRYLDFVKRNPDMSWTKLHSPGSVENSDLAHQLGISTEPSFFIIDKGGRLVESEIGISGIEREIERERRR